MHALIIITGLIIGSILIKVVNNISYSIDKIKRKNFNIFIPIIFSLSCEVIFLRLGFNIMLAKVIVATGILVIISYIDFRHKIIPNIMVIVTAVIGIIFAVISKASVLDTVFGMICGGGIMLLLGIVPNTIGGGDIKFMFAMGAFLGVNKTIWTLLLAFSISSIVSIFLILFKVKGGKDYIPFGPFLSLGSFISFLIFI